MRNNELEKNDIRVNIVDLDLDDFNIKDYNAIYLCGGEPKYLMDAIYRENLFSIIKEQIRIDVLEVNDNDRLLRLIRRK